MRERFSNAQQEKLHSCKCGCAILRCLIVSVAVSSGMVGIALMVDKISNQAISVAGVLLWLIAFIPGLMLTVRRLHDLDKPP